MKISYRPVAASAHDVSLYRGLEQSSGPFVVPTESDDEAMTEISRATAEFIYVDGCLAGVVSFIRPPGTYNAELDFIALYPYFEHKGIASRVLTEKMQAYRDCFAGVSLTVHPDNARAIRLYERLGFVKDHPLVELEYGPRWIMTWRPGAMPHGTGAAD